MKNPFVMMALMAAAMTEAFRENAFRDAGLPIPSGKRIRRAGKRRPAGAKLVMRFYRAKHGHKAQSVEEAREWYAAYLKEQDTEARRKEAQRKYLREASKGNLLKAA